MHEYLQHACRHEYLQHACSHVIAFISVFIFPWSSKSLPSQQSMDTAKCYLYEYSLMVSRSSDIVDIIKQSPGPIGLELFARGLFSEDDRDFVCEVSASKRNKATRVVTVVTDRTRHNPEVLAQFVDILQSVGQWTQDAVKLLTEVVIDEEPVVDKPAINASTDSLNLYDLIDTTSPLTTSFELSERDLSDETLTIRGEFAGLIVNVVDSMQKRNVKVELLVRFLGEIEAVTAVTAAAKKPIYLFEREGLRFSTIDEVFDFLRGYYSWFNYQLIELLINAFCMKDEDVMYRSKVYKSKMEEYCKHRLCRVPAANGFGKGMKGSKQFSFKIDQEWNKIRINQITFATAFIAKTLKLKRVALYLRTTRNGCVELTYDIPVRVMAAILPVSIDTLSMLQKHKIKPRAGKI